jgi:hypothetical protein
MASGKNALFPVAARESPHPVAEKPSSGELTGCHVEKGLARSNGKQWPMAFDHMRCRLVAAPGPHASRGLNRLRADPNREKS